MKPHLFLLILFSCLFSPDFIHAQGIIDPTFGTNGIKTFNTVHTDATQSNSTNEFFNATLIQPDGKILLAGRTDSASIYVNSFFITRLNKDGSYDATFNGGKPKVFQFLNSGGGYNLINEIKAIALQDDGKILFTGITGPSSTSYAMFVHRLNPDGTLETGTGFLGTTTYGTNTTGTCIFYNNTTKKIFVGTNASVGMSFYRFDVNGTFEANSTAQSYDLAYSITTNADGSIVYLAGAFNNGSISSFTVAKYLGTTLDANFHLSNNPITNLLFPSSGNNAATSMILLPDGKIQLGGYIRSPTASSPRDFAFIRLKPNGNLDSTYGNVAVTPGRITYDLGGDEYANSMVLQTDGSIIASGTTVGTAPATFITAIRIDSKGVKDNTFGTNGVFSLTTPQGSCNASDIDISTGTVVMAGANVASNMDLMAIRITATTAPKINILGKQIVSIETENTYRINPVITGYQYTWTYSNSNVYVLGANTNDSVTLYFRSTTPSGILTCNVFNNVGKQIYTAAIPVKVNPEPTLAQQLTDPACTPAQSTCDLSYISSVTITKLHNDGSGCSASGYSDLTAISNYDTLYKGDNYGALVIHGGAIGVNTYCGVWVDLDNNGVINISKEFVGSGLSTGSEIRVNNIFIPNDVELGPKRLRVRVRKGSPFTADDFCINNNDLGETQDYLILMQQYQDFQAPNFITPNNDGKNDYFIIHGVKPEQKNEFKVYSKSGDLVYETDHYDNLWGGRNKSNELLVKGTYYYVFIKDPDSNDAKNVERGFFEIRY